jgi:hypothetical protein
MNLIAFLFWVVVAMFVGGCCLCLHIGYRFGLEDRQPHRLARPAHVEPGTPLADIYPDLAVPDDYWDSMVWDRLVEQTTTEARERMLRDTGELTALTATGELRQLAYAGDLAALAADTAAFIASLEEGDAA